MTRLLILSIALLGLSSSIMAQDVLTLEDAIAIALEQNYSIKVARNDASIADNNAHPGGAGLLPTIAATGGLSYSNQNTRQVFAGGIPSNEVDGAVSKIYNAGVGASYTLFDGLGNVYNLKQLNALAGLGEVQTRLLIESTVLQVVSTYLNVAQLSDNLKVIRQTAAVSKDRYDRQATRSEYGAPKIDLLNAEVDLNTDSVALVTAETNLANAKRDLNVLLGRETQTDFEVDLALSYDQSLILEDLRDRALQNNAALVVASQNMEVAKFNRKMSKSSLSPIIDGTANYGYNRSENDAGILLENQTLGFTGGLNVTWNIFSGRQRLVQIQNAKLQLESSQARYDEALKQVDRDVLNAFASYQTNLYTLRMSERNLETAQLNFERTNDLFELGQVTTTQFREAQLNLATAEQRITQSIINAKLAEVELYRLSGQLLETDAQ